MRLIWKIKTKPIKFCNLFSSAPRSIDGQPHQDQLNMVIQSLLYQAEEFQNYLDLSKKQRKSQRPDFLNEHHAFLDDITKKLRSMNVPCSMSSSTLTFLPQSSTPYRSNYNRKPLTFSIGSQIANSSQFCWEKKSRQNCCKYVNFQSFRLQFMVPSQRQISHILMITDLIGR